MNQYLELGKVNNTHGLRGEVKVALWCDDISYVKQLKYVYLDDRGDKRLTLISARPQKNIGILKFAEITTIEQAQELKNKIIYCNRDDAHIDDDAYYIADVIGCRVVDKNDGRDYGEIVDVTNYGSCDIFDTVLDKRHTLIPAIPDIIDRVDTENRVVTIIPMKGLFDED